MSHEVEPRPMAPFIQPSEGRWTTPKSKSDLIAADQLTHHPIIKEQAPLPIANLLGDFSEQTGALFG